MKLITEHQSNITSINEKVNDQKRWYVQGVFGESEQKNRNGRIYPKKILEREVANYQASIYGREALGELNHPERPEVDPRYACHRVVSLEQQGLDFIGKSLILAGTKWGDHLISLLENECQLGISSRGLGSLKVQGNVATVQEDFHLSCFDIVLNPSANKAFVNGIMEGKDFIYNNGIIVEQAATKIKSSLDNGKRVSQYDLSQLFELTQHDKLPVFAL